MSLSSFWWGNIETLGSLTKLCEDDEKFKEPTSDRSQWVVWPKRFDDCIHNGWMLSILKTGVDVVEPERKRPHLRAQYEVEVFLFQADDHVLARLAHKSFLLLLLRRHLRRLLVVVQFCFNLTLLYFFLYVCFLSDKLKNYQPSPVVSVTSERKEFCRNRIWREGDLGDT